MTRCLLFLLMSAAAFAGGPEIVTVPEMARIPVLEPAPTDRSPPKKAPLAFQLAWKAVAPGIAQRLTPDLVRALSRWARPQMERYVRVASVQAPKWTVERVTAEGTLVLAARVENLPVHVAIVTRWLELVATFDPAKKSIERVWITIRGQAEE